jgi:hypothetical protein
VRHDGKPAIRRMSRDFMANDARIRRYDYDRCVDVKEQRVGANFDVESMDPAGARTALRSADPWRARGALFREAFVDSSGMNPLHRAAPWALCRSRRRGAADSASSASGREPRSCQVRAPVRRQSAP